MTRQLKEYANAVIGDPHKEKELTELACGAMDMIKATSPEAYYAILFKAHCIAYGCHFDKQLAKEAVARMHNVDGTTGEHWTYEQVESVARQNGIEDVPGLYYSLNMLYSDLSGIFGNDANMYVRIAKALYFDDPDMPKGKLFRQWYALQCDM